MSDLNNTARKDNVKDCKAPLKYLHPDFLIGTAYGMLAGEYKYNAWNYTLGHDMQDLIDAAIRHLLAIRSGEMVDPDTTERLREHHGDNAPEVTHLDLAACNINMIKAQIAADTLRDDYPTELQNKMGV